MNNNNQSMEKIFYISDVDDDDDENESNNLSYYEDLLWDVCCLLYDEPPEPETEEFRDQTNEYYEEIYHQTIEELSQPQIYHYSINQSNIIEQENPDPEQTLNESNDDNKDEEEDQSVNENNQNQSDDGVNKEYFTVHYDDNQQESDYVDHCVPIRRHSV